MAIRVTKAITKYGRVYAVGDIIDNPTSVELSLRRLYKWETVDDSAPSLYGMRKPDLVQLAESRGLDVDGLTKPELIDLLES
jgi:hypothetical protein